MGRLTLILTFVFAFGSTDVVALQDRVSEGEGERVSEPRGTPAAQVPHSLTPSLPHSRFKPFPLPFKERLRIALLTALAIVWFFWLGAALGSYLNVVVYRMPLGLASVAPDSRCPKCQTPIRWYDNVPVVSWLLLRGRCRACHEPISLRYLIVEILMGAIFVGLLGVEVLSGGAIYRNRPGRGYDGMPMIEHLMEWDLLGIYFYHAALLWFLVGFVLFWIDGHPVPKRFVLAGLMVGLLPPLVWPALRQLPFMAALITSAASSDPGDTRAGFTK